MADQLWLISRIQEEEEDWFYDIPFTYCKCTCDAADSGGVLTEHQLTTAVTALCTLVNTTNDKVVCSKTFRCLAVQSLPKRIIIAQVIKDFSQLNTCMA